MLNSPYYRVMATESAPDTEFSVTLPPALSTWLEERAAVLGVPPETLLVEVLETHREAADYDDELSALFSETANDGDRQASIAELEGRIDDVDRALSEHVEDLRSRILQLKDAVNSRAPEAHGHTELEILAERVDELATDVEQIHPGLDDLESELETVSADVEATDGRFETVENKLHRLAQVVLELKRDAVQRDDSTDALDRLRRIANERGTTSADCDGCGEHLRIGLLTEAACPHCGHGFHDIEYPSSIFGRFKTPTLIDEVTDPMEIHDE